MTEIQTLEEHAEDATIFYSKEDFIWWKKTLDVNRKYEHRHNGEPEKYPCKLLDSRWWDDHNGPYTYDHSFAYQKKVKCSSCGHETHVWDD